jgi:magnesium chelatase accessory protein
MPALDWDRDGREWPHREASHFVEAAGLRWHVQRMGAPDRPVLLLIHGTGAASHSWRGLMPLLARDYQVIAPDLPGHGFTQTPPPHRMSLPGMAGDLAALLRVLKLKPQVVVGHSAGAAIAARMCLDGTITPELLVSLNGAFLPYGGAAAPLLTPLSKLLVLNPVVPRLFAWQAAAPGTVRRLLDATGSTIDATGAALYGKLVGNRAHVTAALQMMAYWQLGDLLKALPRLQPQLLLVVGDNDKAIAPTQAATVREVQPRAIIERLHGLGHLAHEEAPQPIAELIQPYAASEHAKQRAQHL